MLPALLLAFQLPITLPTVLEQWKSEIEARTFNKIEILRIPGDVGSAQDRQVLTSYFKQPDFAESFSRAQALTFRYEMAGRSRSLILLNLARMEQTQNSPPVLIAHELGHIWLASLGLLPPQYEPGPEACLAIHYGDIAQHILIRRESDRRKFDWRTAYARDYESAYESLRQQPVSAAMGDACFRAQRLSLMVDVRDSFAAGAFAARDPYLEILAAQDRDAEAIAIEVLEQLDGKIGLEQADYDAALRIAKQAVYRLLGMASPQ